MKALALALVAFLVLPATAAERDPMTGDWAADCRPDLQCWIEIRSSQGEALAVRYVAAERLDASAIRCEASGVVSRDDTGILRGVVGRDQIEIVPGDAGDLFLTGGGNDPCGGPLAFNGRYTAFGDE